MIRLFNYSETPINEVYSTSQDISEIKPIGLCVTTDDEDGWATWCHAEDFPLKPIKIEVILKQNHNVLHISNRDQFLQFSKTYKISSYRIDWVSVANHYQGILIQPYFWEFRLKKEHLWYYGWDVACGWIWDKEAIQAVKIASKKSILDWTQYGF